MSSIKKKLSEVKQTASLKIHSTFKTGTSDKEFDKLRDDIIEQKKFFKSLQNSILKFQEATVALSSAQQSISKNLTKIVGDQPSHMVAISNEFGFELEKNSKESEALVKMELIGLIENYLAQYAEIEKRMDERYKRMTAMDKAEKELKGVQKAGSGLRSDDYSHNHNLLRENYEALNAELKNDMALLVADKSCFLDLLFPLIVAAQGKYIGSCWSSCQVLSQLASQADYERVKNYPHLITPYSSSSMYSRKKSQLALEHSAPQPTITFPDKVEEPVAHQSPIVTGGKTPRVLPALPPMKARARVLYDWTPRTDTEMAVRVDEEVVVLSQGDDWWQVQSGKNVGYVPANYLQQL